MATMPKKNLNVVIVGGHGKVGLRLATLLNQSKAITTNIKVTSLIRTTSHEQDILSTGSTPHILSLEDSPTSSFTQLFEKLGTDVVYFVAGAGGKGGDERTKKVDYEGAVKIFDAIEGVVTRDDNEGKSSKPPRLILLSAIDVRDPEGSVPAHYDEQDVQISQKYHSVLKTYIKWKYEADQNLVKRTMFDWTILRPGTLKDEEGTGKVCIGRTHLRPGIPRDDVAKVLAGLVDRGDAAGLTIDLVGGEVPVEEALDGFIKKGETDYLG